MKESCVVAKLARDHAAIRVSLVSTLTALATRGQKLDAIAVDAENLAQSSAELRHVASTRLQRRHRNEMYRRRVLVFVFGCAALSFVACMAYIINLDTGAQKRTFFS